MAQVNYTAQKASKKHHFRHATLEYLAAQKYRFKRSGGNKKILLHTDDTHNKRILRNSYMYTVVLTCYTCALT
jgi:hypothetical protein